MRAALRILASLNAVFQAAVAALCVLAPRAAAGVFELSEDGPSVRALTRMFGGLIFGSALLSALVARDPERNPDLLLLLIAGCLANLAADSLVVGSGEMLFAQLGAGMVVQVILVGVAVRCQVGGRRGQAAARHA